MVDPILAYRCRAPGISGGAQLRTSLPSVARQPRSACANNVNMQRG